MPRSSPPSPVRIGISVSLVPDYLPGLETQLDKFRQQYPHIEMRFRLLDNDAVAEGVEQGLIRFVGDDCKKALYDAIEARQVRPGLCKTAGLKLVYSPLNGSGLVPVTHVLNDMGITDITIVARARSTPTATLPPAPTRTPKFSRL